MDEIVNKVANSKLVQIDLAEYYTQGPRVEFDIKPWLYEELILKENDFRKYVADHDWTQYQDQHVNIVCSADAIVPSWAFLLIGLHLESVAKTIVQGNRETLEIVLFENFFKQFDFQQFEGKLLIVKGCGNLPIPPQAYINFVTNASKFAKSIMFGEPCSSVPLFKRK